MVVALRLVKRQRSYASSGVVYQGWRQGALVGIRVAQSEADSSAGEDTGRSALECICATTSSTTEPRSASATSVRYAATAAARSLSTGCMVGVGLAPVVRLIVARPVVVGASDARRVVVRLVSLVSSSSGFRRFQARSDANQESRCPIAHPLESRAASWGQQVRVVLVDAPLHLRTALD